MQTGAIGAAEGTRSPSRRRRATDAAGVPESAGTGSPVLDTALLSPEVRAELARLTAEGEALRRELSEARIHIAQLERLADEDSLTPIANRRAFVRELSRTIAFTQRYGLPSSIVYFDVNGMKQINDVHGHLAGDAALRHIAQVLRENVRSSDLVGRLGGDEFAVILTQADQEQAAAKAAALAETIESTPLRWGSVNIPVDAAYGVYSFSGNEDAQVAMEAADRAMYRQKKDAARSSDEARPQ
jgi:diguanylate cyclase (GGDEF)-like protein